MPSIAIFAAEFASAVGVDGPCKGHCGVRASIENAAAGDFIVADFAFSLEQGAKGSEADEARRHVFYFHLFFARRQYIFGFVVQST
jgi:hypothetical protein